ncbi:hypothetical protein RA307_17785 [Xanthobacteraceae bacterium Astr-EGSB]|uniref:hypothetical protein n=1 Tax=Astrobacterium formosum TaxID=3069710 RepID=UPI0027B73499|nr:hypothetical protein [Xanthobacteraceae bacterium Astr-EGSB]
MKVRNWVSCMAAAALAAGVGSAGAACYAPAQQLPATTVSNFIGSPASLLSDFPNGGAQMISRVRDLVASNPDALAAIMAQLANANTSQQSAIGSGLGQAARICLRTDQAFATQIQQAIASQGTDAAKAAYAAVNPDVQIGAVGAAGAGGGTGVGGPTAGIGGGANGSTAPAVSSFGALNQGSVGLTGTTGSGAGALSDVSAQ